VTGRVDLDAAFLLSVPPTPIDRSSGILAVKGISSQG